MQFVPSQNGSSTPLHTHVSVGHPSAHWQRCKLLVWAKKKGEQAGLEPIALRSSRPCKDSCKAKHTYLTPFHLHRHKHTYGSSRKQRLPYTDVPKWKYTSPNFVRGVNDRFESCFREGRRSELQGSISGSSIHFWKTP